MGYVIQDGGLFPHLTAAGNVTLMAGELRWEGGRIRKRLAELAEIILRNCPGVQILATSREGLNILGETTYPLAPLSVPDFCRYTYWDRL